MHILFILEHFSPHVWGVEILFENLILWLQKKGYRITVLTSKFNKEIPSYEKINDTYEIYRVGHNRYDFILYSLRLGYKLAKKADIIHTTTYTASIPAWFIAKLTKKKIIITVHEIFGKLWKSFVWWKWPFFRLFEKTIFLLPFNTYICVSNYTKNMLAAVEKISEGKMITIYNGINYDIWTPSAEIREKALQLREVYELKNSYVWFFFGRPWISKWLEFFIRAIPDIVKKIPEFKAYLLVARDDLTRLHYVQNLAKDLGVQEYIIWWKKVPYKELPAYIDMADFTIVPSLVEWFGFAAVEACSMWKPVIVSKSWSLPEVVSGKTVFIQPWDYKDIAAKVYEVYQGSVPVLPVKQFLWDDNIETTSQLYEIYG